MDTNQRLARARKLIEEKRYEEAKKILTGLDHDTARKWLAKINDILDEDDR